MVATNETCALCGLEIIDSFLNNAVNGEEQHFCCQGCARVYQVALENDMLDQVLAQPIPKPSGLKDGVFKPGETAYFSIGGMWCAGCAVAAEQVLRNQPGIKNVDISFAIARAGSSARTWAGLSPTTCW